MHLTRLRVLAVELFMCALYCAFCSACSAPPPPTLLLRVSCLPWFPSARATRRMHCPLLGRAPARSHRVLFWLCLAGRLHHLFHLLYLPPARALLPVRSFVVSLVPLCLNISPPYALTSSLAPPCPHSPLFGLACLVFALFILALSPLYSVHLFSVVMHAQQHACPMLPPAPLK
ncbi:hypothetical protein I4F81_010307 [Pyropia yezoensis]|uniref:Uncharacterized protein n=1 Tax=Pyropia yezoensis TaxID=2788 RepID=A0ACC3CD93_PYRYE|nr:hypothetical protein I4F81_010307 [Neopyropia yezoensis]